MGTTASSVHVLLPSANDGSIDTAFIRAYEETGFAPASEPAGAKRVVLVKSSNGPYVSAYDSDNEQLDTGDLKEIAVRLSKQLATSVIFTGLYDSDAFIFILYYKGEQIDAAAAGEVWNTDGLKALRGKARAKKWSEVFASLAPDAKPDAWQARLRIESSDDVFAEQGLARWCAAAGLDASSALLLSDDFAGGDENRQTTLYFTATGRKREKASGRDDAQQLTFFRSDDDMPELRVYPAAWPVAAKRPALLDWGVATSGPGFQGIRLRLACKATGGCRAVAAVIERGRSSTDS